MTKTYTAIPTIHLNAETDYAHPQSLPELVHLEDPALAVMTDLKQAIAITISPDAPLNEAALEMRVCNKHMLLVTNHKKQIIGLITTEDLLGEKPLRVAMERKIKRSEVIVRAVMTRQENIVVFDINELNHAKVGNIVESLHQVKQHYALVVEQDASSNQQVVRGIISLWDISHRVGEDLTYDVHEAHSLLELQNSLKG